MKSRSPDQLPKLRQLKSADFPEIIISPADTPIKPLSFTPKSSTPKHKKLSQRPTKSLFTYSGIVKSCTFATHTKPSESHNQDRVCIIHTITRPVHRTNELWPRASWFAVYDGHRGSSCANFLKENLHKYVIGNSNFPFKPKEAIQCGFEAAETAFLAQAAASVPVDYSGSCGIIVLLVDDTCYVANVGDSRAVMSGHNGSKIYSLSKDHKPNEKDEKLRITANGGRVYSDKGSQQLVARVSPGRLSVSRAFGNIHAKEPGSTSNVITAVPVVKAFKLSPDHDFIVIGSDGLFNSITNREAIQRVWVNLLDRKHQQLYDAGNQAVDSLINLAVAKGSNDDITAVLVTFQNVLKKLSK